MYIECYVLFLCYFNVYIYYLSCRLFLFVFLLSAFAVELFLVVRVDAWVGSAGFTGDSSCLLLFVFFVISYSLLLCLFVFAVAFLSSST